MSPWISYSLLRIGVFALVFAILYVALPGPLASVGIIGYTPIAIIGAVSAIIALAVSYLFLGRLREQVARDVVERRARTAVDPDADDEDAAAGADSHPETDASPDAPRHP